MSSKSAFLVLITALAAIMAVSYAIAEVSGSGMILTRSMYGIGEAIEGKVNITLSSEPADSAVTALGKNTSLLDFLKNNNLEKDKDYLCTPEDCNDYYETVGISTKQKSLQAGDTLIGSIAVGKDIEIKQNALEFSITGNGGEPVCGVVPLKLDLLADNSIDWVDMEPSDLCGSLQPSSCYDDTSANLELDITTTPYCQKIYLPISARFKISALVKKNTGGGDLSAFIYDKKIGESTECDLPEPNVTSYTETNCMVDLKVYGNNQDYYVCIQDNSIDGAYTIKAEKSSPICGYSDLPGRSRNESADFALLVQGTATIPLNRTVTFNEQEFSKFSSVGIGEYLQDYLNKRHSSNCLDGCIIPIRIISSNAANLKDMRLSYCAQGLCTTEQSFFGLERKSSMIDMNMTSLDLSAANLSAEGYGLQTFSFSIGGVKIGEEEISIERVPVIKNLVALNAEAGAAVDFFAEAYSPKNNTIVSYEWIFGDGGTATAGSSVTHEYKNVGEFKVTVTAVDSQGLKGSRSSKITVGSPQEIINMTLSGKRIIFNELKNEIDKAGWYKGLIEKQLGTAEISTLLSDYENQFRFATTPSEYIELMPKVSKFIIPQSIYDSEFVTEIPITVDVDSIKPELIEGLNGGVYDSSRASETRNAIWAWQHKNVAMTATSRVMESIDENENRAELATIITLRIKPLTQLEESYLVILAPYESATFASDYNQRDVAGNIGFVLDSLSSDYIISFAVTGRVDISSLEMFMSPYLANLEIEENIVCNSNRVCEKNLGENWKTCRDDCKPIGLALILLIFALAAMAAAYIFLQKWYKTKYEKYLFKEQHDLSNMVSFASNSLRRGESENDVKGKLKQAGWNLEQIYYIFRKIKGEKVGMPEVKIKWLDMVKNLLKHRKV
ncbi:MAG: PKD domain-containing protein [archaeon]